MDLVPYFDADLYQMYVKIPLLNGDLHGDVFMTQPEGSRTPSK